MPATKRDYYEVLGVTRSCGEQELKVAYRKLALQYHPDRNPGDADAEEKFKEAAEAYGILSDAQKRAAYDAYGHAGISGMGGGFDPSQMDLGDLLSQVFGFGDIFGGRRSSGGGRPRATKGDDLRYDMSLQFEEAAFGKSIEIQVPKMEACARCRGRGAEPDSQMMTCPACHGRGEQLYSQGFLSVRRTCSHCGGAGEIVKQVCRECRGEGYKHVNKRLKVTVPAGIADGNRLRVSGEGQPGANGGPNGDLYIFFSVKEHPIFERHNNDLHCRIPINMAQAALGAKIQAPTLEGLHELTIPEGTQNGAQLRVKGKGVAEVQGRGRGDLIVHIDVRTPTKLSRDQRQLLEQLRDSLPVDNDPHEKGLLDKVKDYFM
ncbi:MAG TPA: molecular chaperone DnaJ [Bryobacteraceae bacterium]|nr:molecular chaperone DnaJ [Bryobacteraceae bacterium]